MAEKILQTRILNKVDTLEAWNSSSLKLKKGELAFCTVAASAGTGLSEPVVMVKIGTEEEKTFAELPWAFHAKASDVLAACKTEAGLKAFVKTVLTEQGVASDEVLQALAQRVTTAEGEIDTLQSEMDAVEKKAADNAAAITALQGLVGDTAVATQITNAINALSTVYAAKSLETTVDNHIKDTVAHVTADDKVKWNNALQSADVATGSANGTIAVKGNDVAVKGLGSAAYTEASAYDVSGAAAGALAEAKTYAEGQAAAAESAAKSHAETKAADALAAAKTYAEGQASAAQTAAQGYADTAAADALADAKEYVNEVTGGKTVSESINATIANYSTTAQMNEAIAAAKGEAVKHANDLDKAMDERVDALEADTHTHSFVESELNLIKAGDVAKWNAAEQNAKDYADGLNTAMDSRVDALEAKFTGEDSVADQIADAVAAEAKLREDADAELQNAIDAIEADYLVEADKTALQGAIAALDELVGDEAVSKQITDVTNPLAARVKAVEDDYLKAADKTELTNAIATAKQEAVATVLGEGTSADFDTLKEVADWILSDTTGAAALQKDVAAIKADYLKAADKTELEGKITAAQNAADKAQGEVDALEGVVAKKAAQADLEALDDRVEAVEGELNTATTGLKARMTQAEADIDALEVLVGDDSVSTQITNAVNELKNGQLKTMQGEIDAVEGRADALEAKAHEHANKAELDKIADGDKAKWDAKLEDVTAAADSGLKATKTGNTVAIEIDDTLVWVFDCGGAEVEAAN